MKFSLFTSLLFLGVSSFAAPKFVQLEASSANGYPVGQAAVLTVHVRIQPTNPNDEIYLSSALYSPGGGGINQKITRISDSEGVSVTPALTTVGNYTWHVNVYLQNKVKAAQLEASIVSLFADIERINRLLEVETDPTTRTALETERNASAELLGRTQGQLNENRTGLGSEQLVIPVNPAKSLIPFETPVISIEASRENPSYAVNERAVFFVHALTDFTGPDGIQEVLAFAQVNGSGSLPGLNVDRKQLGPKDFSFTSPILTSADVGHRSFSASLKIRSKAQADNIRTSRTKAIARRGDYIAKRDAAQNAAKRAYYQKLVGEMDMVVNDLNRQLTAMLTDVPSSKEFFFDVVSSN